MAATYFGFGNPPSTPLGGEGRRGASHGDHNSARAASHRLCLPLVEDSFTWTAMQKVVPFEEKLRDANSLPKVHSSRCLTLPS